MNSYQWAVVRGFVIIALVSAVFVFSPSWMQWVGVVALVCWHGIQSQTITELTERVVKLEKSKSEVSPPVYYQNKPVGMPRPN